MIEDIIELMKLLNESSLVVKFRGESKTKELYRGVKSGRFRDIESVADYFYDGDKKPSWDLCRLLKTKLINRILSIETTTTNNNSYIKNISQAHKLHSIAQIFRRKAAWRLSTRIATQGLDKAIQLKETLLVVSFAKILHVFYSRINYDSKKSKHYRDLIIQQSKVLEFETKAEIYNLDVTSCLMNKHSVSQAEIDNVINKANELNALITPNKSLRFIQMSYSTIVVANQLGYHQERVIEQSQKAIEFFSSIQEPIPVSYFTTFYFSQVNAFIQSNQHQKANETLQRCFSLAKHGTQNWIIAIQYTCINAFYNREYKEAVTAYAKLKKNTAIYEQHREQLLIIEAIIFLLKKTGRAEWKGRRFRLSSFLNDVPVLSKDKAGLNITILMLQVMFLLIEKNYDEMIDTRLDALKIYSSRYLRAASTARSKVFIRMLRLLPKASFRSKRWQVLTADLYAELRALKNRELEFIPYETLVSIILQALKKKRIS